MLWYSWVGPRTSSFSCLAAFLCCNSALLEPRTWSPAVIFDFECSVNQVEAVFIPAHESFWLVTCAAVLRCSGSSVGAVDTIARSRCQFPFGRGGEKPDPTYSPPSFQVALLSCSLLLLCPEGHLVFCLQVHCYVPGLSSSVFLNICSVLTAVLQKG